MINITYKGFDEKPILNPLHLEQFYNVIDFSLTHLLWKEKNSKRINISIYIERSNNLDGNIGETEVDDDNYKEFSIYLSKKLKGYNLLSTVVHELTHVKQYVRKDLRFTSSLNISLWKGKKFYDKKYSYWLYPWEIEAYGYEKCIMEYYINSQRLKLEKDKYKWLFK